MSPSIAFRGSDGFLLRRMAKNSTIQKKWIQNFLKCPLIDKGSQSYKSSFCKQLFYGRTDDAYPADYPEGYKSFYDKNFNSERAEAVDVLLKHLNFIGIRLSKESIQQHLVINPTGYHKLLQKGYYLLRSIAHSTGAVDPINPFKNNQWDLDFFTRIETGQSQLMIFEDLELPELYNKYVKIPEGYENDPVARALFDRIENSNESFFITGKAGTGKSTFIHYFAKTTKKRVLLTAFTGIAAINVGGVTIHSFFRLPPRALLPNDEEIKIFHEADTRRDIIRDLEVIVIDEVSMLRSDLLQAIDYSLRHNGGNAAQPFGGKQVIFVGDLFQLPPVLDSTNEAEDYLFNERFKSEYFFSADAYQQLSPNFFEFQESHRQKADLEFVHLLDTVRSCNVDETTLNKINSRFDPNYRPKPEEFAITLTTTNKLAKLENERRLNGLPTSKFQFIADIKGSFDTQKFPASEVLELKKYAQVIFIKNDPTGEKRWVNGTIGIIDFIAEDLIEVKLSDGKTCKVDREIWEQRRYKYDRTKGKIVSEVVGTFTQYPIKLAWAITIHKSQGLTFNNVIVDLGWGAFVNGQLYTALSRCRTLNGITLRKKIRPDDVITDKRLIEFYSNPQQILSHE
jgi:ATP-dependent DNA helicase PIF1